MSRAAPSRYDFKPCPSRRTIIRLTSVAAACTSLGVAAEKPVSRGKEAEKESAFPGRDRTSGKRLRTRRLRPALSLQTTTPLDRSGSFVSGERSSSKARREWGRFVRMPRADASRYGYRFLCFRRKRRRLVGRRRWSRSRLQEQPRNLGSCDLIRLAGPPYGIVLAYLPRCSKLLNLLPRHGSLSFPVVIRDVIPARHKTFSSRRDRSPLTQKRCSFSLLRPVS